MTDDAREQANGAADLASPEERKAKSEEEGHQFRVHVVWEGDGSGAGEARSAEGSWTIPIGGSAQLGGSGRGVNAEEMLLAAVGNCFVTTWAIFLKKLQVAYAEPALRLSGDLGRDPAGGYKMQKIQIVARVPAELLRDRGPDVKKTLQLAEKYCVISKVARAAMPVVVEMEAV